MTVAGSCGSLNIKQSSDKGGGGGRNELVLLEAFFIKTFSFKDFGRNEAAVQENLPQKVGMFPQKTLMLPQKSGGVTTKK